MFNKSDYLDRVVGTNKRRDLLILQQLAQGVTCEKVSQQFGLSESRVSQIAEANRELLDELTRKTKLPGLLSLLLQSMETGGLLFFVVVLLLLIFLFGGILLLGLSLLCQ